MVTQSPIQKKSKALHAKNVRVDQASRSLLKVPYSKTSSNPEIALTGAGGRLGYFLNEYLDLCESYVRPMNRKDHGDLSQGDFRPFLKDCFGLVHAAFDHVPGAYRGGEGANPARFWDLNFNATLRLLEQAREVGVRKVVLFSSRAVYGAHQVFGETAISEVVAAEPDSHYGALKAATETLARLYSDQQMQVTVLRPTGIYGGHPQNNKWAPMFRDCLRGILPNFNFMATEVYGKTVAQAMGLVLQDQRGDMAGRVFNLSEVRVSTSQILGFAGFNVSSMPSAVPLQGPELSSRSLEQLGLRLKGLEAVQSCALRLRKDLELDKLAIRQP